MNISSLLFPNRNTPPQPTTETRLDAAWKAYHAALDAHANAYGIEARTVTHELAKAATAELLAARRAGTSRLFGGVK